jgi:hypothetical protein
VILAARSFSREKNGYFLPILEVIPVLPEIISSAKAELGL